MSLAAETLIPYSGRTPAKPDGDEANVQSILHILTGDKDIVSKQPDYLSISLLEATIGNQQLSIQLKTNEFLRVYREKLRTGAYAFANPKLNEELAKLNTSLQYLYTYKSTDGTKQNEFIKESLKVLLSDMLLYTGEMELFCTKQTCLQMKGYSPQIYLCAAHQQPRECCAIDYCNDTIISLLEVLKSRTLTQKRTQAALFQYFVTAVRRAHRIFLHLHASHFVHFIRLERNLLLCTRFEYFCQANRLLSSNAFLQSQIQEILGQRPPVQRVAADTGLQFPDAGAPPAGASPTSFTPPPIDYPINVDRGHYLIYTLRSEKYLTLIDHPDLVNLGREQPLTKYNLPSNLTFEDEKALAPVDPQPSTSSSSLFPQ